MVLLLLMLIILYRSCRDRIPDDCAIGQWLNQLICQPHSTCSATQVEDQTPDKTQDRTCRNRIPDDCADGEWLHNTICKAHSAACSATQVEDQAPDKTQDRVCRDAAVLSPPKLVTVGNCTGAKVNAAGTCFESDNRPGKYANNKKCTVEVQDAPGMLSAEGTFNIENHSTCRYDGLIVKGKKYCGSNRPTDVPVQPGDTIKFYTDGSVTRTGFKVCVAPVEPAEPTASANSNTDSLPYHHTDSISTNLTSSRWAQAAAPKTFSTPVTVREVELASAVYDQGHGHTGGGRLLVVGSYRGKRSWRSEVIRPQRGSTRTAIQTKPRHAVSHCRKENGTCDAACNGKGH